MGRVLSVTTNANNEVTSAEILKGKTREKIFRHSSVLIPLLTNSGGDSEVEKPPTDSSTLQSQAPLTKRARPKRRAAVISEIKTKDMLD